MPTDSSNGLHLKGPAGTEFSASQDTVDSFERMWNSTLEWAQGNPSLFLAFLTFLLIALFICIRGWNDKTKLKHEYEDARENARTQIQLPFNDKDDAT